MLLPVSVVASLDYFRASKVISVRVISAGLSNRNYHVRSDCGDVLLRIFGDEHPHQVRRAEVATQQLAHDLNIAPEPLAHYPPQECSAMFCQWLAQQDLSNNGLMLCQYVSGEHLSGLLPLDVSSLTLLAGQLSLLHCSNPTLIDNLTVKPQDPCALLASYWYLFSDKTVDNSRRYRRLIAALDTLYLDADCIIHGDLNGTNILVAQGRLTFIDWEFCGVSDRYFDLATLVVELALDSAQTDVLLSAYGGDVSLKKLHLMALYYIGLCWLWQPISLSSGELPAYQKGYISKLDQMLELTA